MSSDAIVILKADHKEIRDLFRKFQAAGDKAVKTKERIAGQIIELLTVHTYIENEVMYPEVCALLPDLKDDVLESYEEHHVADVLCMELAGMPAGAERFDAKATVLIENVTHHIEEEEQDWFPKVRAWPWPQAASGTRGQARAGPEEGAQVACPAQRAEKDDRRRHPPDQQCAASLQTADPACRASVSAARHPAGVSVEAGVSSGWERSSVTLAAASASDITAPPLTTRPCTASSASPPPHETASTSPRTAPGREGTPPLLPGCWVHPADRPA